MKDLRQEARGRDCQVRYVGICNRRQDTTVLAHVRLAGLTGIGQKAHDLHASWACHACHEVADGRVRVPGMTREQVLVGFYEGVLRTQAQLIKQGIISV